MEFTMGNNKVEFRTHLLRTLNLIRGPIRLVLAPSFVRVLGACVADVETLKAHGVETFDTMDGVGMDLDAVHGSNGSDRSDRSSSPTDVYVIHGTVESSARAARHARLTAEARSKNKEKEPMDVYVVCFPRVMKVAKAMFEREGVPDAVFLTLPCAWIPVSRNVLSLEYDDTAIRELFVNALSSPLPYDIAYALFSGGFGCASRVQARGRLSCKVAEMLRRMRREAGRDLGNMVIPSTPGFGAAGQTGGRPTEAVDELILMDRSVDMVTPMCTQFTYEGLLNEVFEMRYGQTKGGALRVNGLDDSDPVFRETREKMFTGARTWVNASLREIQQFRDEEMANADVSALRGFVASLKDNFSRMTLHASLLEKLGSRMASPSFAARQRVEAAILDGTLEPQALYDVVYKEEDLPLVLRLMCLRCAADGGIAKREFDILRKDVLNTHGFDHIKTFERLQEAGLLYEKEDRTRSAFAASRGPMKLLVDDASTIDAEHPDDMHFTYAGYAPWSCRMIEEACSVGWKTRLDDSVNPTIHVRQGLDDDGSAKDTVIKDIPVRESTGSTPRNIVVVFIGGVTPAEVSALGFLANRDGNQIRVASTGIVNGSTLIRSLMAG